jgi:amidase
MEIDAIIAPVALTAALRHNQYRYYGYASVINLPDFMSVVVPVTSTDKNIDNKHERYQPLSEIDRVVYDECEC